MSIASLLLGLLVSLLAAVVPTLLWATVVWLCDRYEREPVPLAIASFLWGAAPAVMVSLFLELAPGVGPLGAGATLLGEIISNSGIAPVVEELAKGAALWLIFLIWRDEIDDVLDGILYGALAGFGFAMTENFLYFVAALFEGSWGELGQTVFLRGVVFGLNHAFYTAFIGAGLGYARVATSQPARRLAPLLGLVAAIAAHALHNLGASLADITPLGLLLSLVSDSGGVLLVATMIAFSLAQERAWLRVELAEDVGSRLTADEYGALLSLRARWAMLRRARRAGGWGALRRAGEFQQRATELAFYRHRARARGIDPAVAERIAELGDRLAAARAGMVAAGSSR